jgi:hypothetical protein
MSQLKSWHSVYQSAKEMLFTPFEIFDNWKCAQDGFPGASQSYTTERKADGKIFLCQVFTADETGTFVLSWRQRGNTWNGTILSLHGRRKINILYEQARSWSLSWTVEWFLWQCREGRQVLRMHQDTDRTQEAFQMTSALEESTKNLAAAWPCMLLHLMMYLLKPHIMHLC